MINYFNSLDFAITAINYFYIAHKNCILFKLKGKLTIISSVYENASLLLLKSKFIIQFIYRSFSSAIAHLNILYT